MQNIINANLLLWYCLLYASIITLIACQHNNLTNVNDEDIIIWQPTALDSLNVTSLAIHPNGDVFARTCGEIFRSIDRGESWISIGNFCPNVLAVNHKGDLFATGGAGLAKSIDNGKSWESFNVSSKVANIRPIVFGMAEEVFVSSLTSDESRGGIYRSLDNGETWTNTNFPDSIGAWVLAINSKNDIFAGTGFSIFRSEDDGQTWLKINNGFKDLGYGSFISSIAIDPVTENIFVAVEDDGVYRSLDNGETWVPTSLTDPTIQSIVIISGQTTHIFAASGKLWSEGNEQGVFYSKDNGENWKQINSGLDNTNVYVLAIDFSGFVYAGTQGSGVSRTVETVKR